MTVRAGSIRQNAAVLVRTCFPKPINPRGSTENGTPRSSAPSYEISDLSIWVHGGLFPSDLVGNDDWMSVTDAVGETHMMIQGDTLVNRNLATSSSRLHCIHCSSRISTIQPHTPGSMMTTFTSHVPAPVAQTKDGQILPSCRYAESFPMEGRYRFTNSSLFVDTRTLRDTESPSTAGGEGSFSPSTHPTEVCCRPHRPSISHLHSPR